MPLLANELFSEVFAVLGRVSPVSSAVQVTSDWVLVSKYARIVAFIQVGSIAPTGTFDAKLQQATSSGGAGAKDITGKAIVQLSAADDNKDMVIDCRADELDTNGGFVYVQLQLTPATAAALVSGALLGAAAGYEPVPQTNWYQAIN